MSDTVDLDLKAAEYDEKLYGLDAFSMTKSLFFAGKEIPPWWTESRDDWLRAFVIANPFVGNAVNTLVYLLNSIDFVVMPKNPGVNEHHKIATFYNDLLKSMLLSADYEKFLFDVLTCDNGGWLYVEGVESANEPIATFPLGLRHLDSAFVQRTGNDTYPAIYRDIYGTAHKMHKSRIVNLTQAVQPFRETFGIGLSFVSRVVMYARHLLDVQVYEDELLGSRSASEIIMLTGANSHSLRRAIADADLENDNAGLSRYGNRVYLGIREPNASLQRVLLKSLPDNFNKASDFELTMGLFSLAAGIAKEHFSLDTGTTSSKASATLAENFSASKLSKWYIDRLAQQISAAFLPAALSFTDVQSASRLNSEKSKVLRDLAFSTRIRLEHGVTDARIERQNLLAQGVLTKDQFDYLELANGRLPNGLPIISVFWSTDPQYVKFITMISRTDFNNFDKITDADRIELQTAKSAALTQSLNSQSGSIQSVARTMYYAFVELEKLYNPVINQQSIEKNPINGETDDGTDLIESNIPGEIS
jgi:hypothetical protein